jgi:hypothetical protein
MDTGILTKEVKVLVSFLHTRCNGYSVITQLSEYHVKVRLEVK